MTEITDDIMPISKTLVHQTTKALGRTARLCSTASESDLD